MSDVEGTVKQFILDEVLPDEDGADLDSETPLMSTGVLDSMSTLKLVMFLEETFGIQVVAHEMDDAHLGTLSRISEFVESRRS